MTMTGKKLKSGWFLLLVAALGMSAAGCAETQSSSWAQFSPLLESAPTDTLIDDTLSAHSIVVNDESISPDTKLTR